MVVLQALAIVIVGALFVGGVALLVIGPLVLIRGAIGGFNKCQACRKRVPRKATVCPHCATTVAIP